MSNSNILHIATIYSKHHIKHYKVIKERENNSFNDLITYKAVMGENTWKCILKGEKETVIKL